MKRILSVLLLAAAPAITQAVTIDFNSLSGNQGKSFTLSGVTFSTTGSGFLEASKRQTEPSAS